MGSATIPTQRIDSVLVGTTSVVNPSLMLKVDGIAYANGYRITYNAGYRNIFPGYDSATGNVYLYCHNVACGEDLPQLSVNNVEVLIIGK
jgi:hypothetical protein